MGGGMGGEMGESLCLVLTKPGPSASGWARISTRTCRGPQALVRHQQQPKDDKFLPSSS